MNDRNHKCLQATSVKCQHVDKGNPILNNMLNGSLAHFWVSERPKFKEFTNMP